MKSLFILMVASALSMGVASAQEKETPMQEKPAMEMKKSCEKDKKSCENSKKSCCKKSQKSCKKGDMKMNNEADKKQEMTKQM
ncbi:MAG: hypothetical protein Q4C98_01565 [Capnocytophaga sp.]|nr:hypothetical protein [Capnocytophaga sp.]